MMQFLKKNWIWLVIIIVLFFNQRVISTLFGISSFSGLTVPQFSSTSADLAVESGNSLQLISKSSYSKNLTAPSSSPNRIIIQDTSLSLHVKDVVKTISDINEATNKFGGFLINSDISKPESAASGSISVRIPEEKRQEALTTFKNMAVKVVSESVYGSDVTDEYVNLEARLEVLTKTKTKYEEILQKAEKITDLIDVQQQLTYTQTQIDSLEGQKKYYEQSAKLTKITIYLATDELSLPYSPTNQWRPAVIFKEAIRSLVQSFRNVGSLTIWGVVYLPFIIPVIVIILVIKRKVKQSSILK